MATEIRYEITAGPSKMDIMLCLFDLPVIDGVCQQRSVRFTVDQVEGKVRQKIGEVEVIIDTVGRESGDYESWNFEGRFVTRNGRVGDPRVKGYYSSRLRKGVYTCKY